jgi:hypothetical protein
MRQTISSLIALLFAVSVMPAGAQTSVEGALENSPVSCFYMMTNAYHEQLNYCGVPLDSDREERFSRMSAAMEDYILSNATLDATAIIANARGAAEQVTSAAPVCTSGEFEENRQAMLDITTPESEALLNDQLATNALLANGSCY